MSSGFTSCCTLHPINLTSTLLGIMEAPPATELLGAMQFGLKTFLQRSFSALLLAAAAIIPATIVPWLDVVPGFGKISPLLVTPFQP